MKVTHRDEFATLCDSRVFTHAIEIGLDRAEYACRLLGNWPNLRTLYCVDPYQPYADAPSRGENGMAWDREADYLTAVQRLATFGERSRIIRARGLAAVKQVPTGNPIGFLYIDGQHTYEACAEDLRLWAPLIHRGGIIAGHDYCEYHHGVIRAVDEFAESIGVMVNVTDEAEPFTAPSWWFYKP